MKESDDLKKRTNEEIKLVREIQKDFNSELDKIVNKVCRTFNIIAICICIVASTWIIGYFALSIFK